MSIGTIKWVAKLSRRAVVSIVCQSIPVATAIAK
jgi:hypothetical protein